MIIGTNFSTQKKNRNTSTTWEPKMVTSPPTYQKPPKDMIKKI